MGDQTLKRGGIWFVACVFFVGCGRESVTPPSAPKLTLSEARKGFATHLVRRETSDVALPNPPAGMFRSLRFPAPSGDLLAYLTPDPGDGKKHPAIVWITGGDSSSLDDGMWKVLRSGDETASGFREAGIVMMFPTLRGGSQNPGVHEGFYGEVDDVVAATDFLSRQPYVDRDRIYLGGLSCGGTLVLLVAESSDRYRAVFAFGAADSPQRHSPEYTFCDPLNRKEIELRSPIRWLDSIKNPTFVIDGTVRSNLASLENMKRASSNSLFRFVPVEGASHVSVLAPIARLIAEQIVKDTGERCNIELTADEASQRFRK
jgi:acetyl esterase/lipase